MESEACISLNPRSRFFNRITETRLIIIDSTAFAYSIPVIAASLAFVTYTSVTKEFDIAVVFSSFSLFQVRFELPTMATPDKPQLLRQPMMFLPRALSATADANHAIERLTETFHAEIRNEAPFHIDPSQENALQASDVTFAWELPASTQDADSEKGDSQGESETELKHPFSIANLNLSVSRGSLVAIVGRFGSGKVNRHPRLQEHDSVDDIKS